MSGASAQAGRAALLEQALAAAVPDWAHWQRGGAGGEWWAAVESPAVAGRRLEILLREDGDVDVCVHHDPRARGPDEAHFPVDDGREAETFRAVASLAADLVAERLVLAFGRGWLRGGREFIRPAALTPERRRRLAWVVSWRGTYDWINPG